MVFPIFRATVLGAVLLTVARLPAQEPDGVRLCVGADRILRQPAGEECGPNEREYLLAKAEPELDKSEGSPEASPAGASKAAAQIADLKQEVAALTQRIAALEGSPSPAAERQPLGRNGPATGRLGHRVVAPFEVVDAAGRPILSVQSDPRGFRLLTAAGEGVVFASALDNAGFVKVTSGHPDEKGNAAREAVVAVTDEVSFLTLRSGGSPRGTLQIAKDGKAGLEIANDDGVGVLSLHPGNSGGGVIQLGDAAGNAMVEAGVTAAGIGVVRTYPAGNPGAGLLGLPGTFISGRKQQ